MVKVVSLQMIFGPIVKCPASVSFPVKIAAKFRDAAASASAAAAAIVSGGGADVASGASPGASPFLAEIPPSFFDEINAQPFFVSPDQE